MTRRTAIAVALLGTLLLAGSAFAEKEPVPARVATTTPTGNEARAQSDVKALLAQVPLPAGATATLTVPPGGNPLPAPTPATPNLADAGGYWTIPSPPATVLSYLQAHIPAGLTVAATLGASTGSQPTAGGVILQAPPIDGVLSQRWLVMELAALPDGTTELHAVGQDVWDTPRPAWERIPSGAASFTLVEHANGKITDRRTVTRAATVRHVVTLINGLIASQPGTSACPLALNETIDLVFDTRSGATLASAAVSPTGCGAVELTIGHRHGGLEDSAALNTALGALGVREPTP